MIRAILLLADAVRTHPDGTFSLLRGGIDRVVATDGKNAALRAGLLVRLGAAKEDFGSHPIEIRLTSVAGDKPPASLYKAVIEFDASHVNSVIAADLAIPLEGPADFLFELVLDGKSVAATWPIRVASPAEFSA